MTKETIPQSIEDKINKEADDHAVNMSEGLNSHAFNMLKNTFSEAAIWGYGLDKWISVKDGLPEELVDVLVCMKRLNSDNYYFIVADYYEGQWNAGDKEDLDNNPDFYVVTHYQYLPKPPKDII